MLNNTICANISTSLSSDIYALFASTTTPTNPDGLQRLAKLLEGSRNQGLLLRLDGPAAYLVVATTMQFPFSLLLSKTVFFMLVWTRCFTWVR